MILVQNLLQRLSGNKVLVVFCFFLISFTSLAQPGEVETTFKNGKEYYVHVVKEGNTLYGIKRTYNVEINELVQHNPGLNQNLSVGQTIYIPTGKTELQAKQEKAKDHVVAKGETLYGLSKKYKCSQQELIDLNPGIEKGLSIGQVLKIPVKNSEESVVQNVPVDTVQKVEPPKVNITWNDSIVEHKVLKHESLYAISKRYMVPINEIKKFNNLRSNKIKVGSIVKIPLKKIETYEIVEKQTPVIKDEPVDSTLHFVYAQKEIYNVVVVMPFCLDKNQSVMSKNQLIGKDDLYDYTRLSLDLYMGVDLALDSLRRKGLSVNLKVVDTKKDTAIVSRFISSDKFKNADLIFGPMLPANIKLLSSAIKSNPQTRLVLPFNSEPKYLANNPQVFNPISSNATLVENLAEYLVRVHGKHKIILLDSGLENDKKLMERFKTRYSEYSIDYPGTRSLSVAKLGSSSGRDFAVNIDRKDTNIVVSLSSARVFASKVMTTLNKVKNKSGGYDDAYLKVFGMPAWEKYKEIKIPYKIKLNFNYPSSYYLNQDGERFKNLTRSYRLKYKTDPNRNAVHSFDVAYCFMKEFFLGLQSSSVMNNFDMQSIGEGHGFENNHLNVIYYDGYQKFVKQ